MNIYLQNEINFDNNGLGFLMDILSIKVTDNLNGDYSLFFEYKLSGNLSEYLENENIIKCKVADGTKQLFIIKNVIKTFDSIQVTAKHIFYQLLDNFIENIAPTNLNGQEFLQRILDGTSYNHNFVAHSNISTTKSARFVRKNPIDCILGDTDNSMINLFGGELKRDNFNIYFNKAIGNDSGVKLIAGKNITGINISIDTSSIHTRIMPQGFDGLLLPEKYVDSPLINVYPTPKIYKVEFGDIKYNPDEEDSYNTLDEAYEALRTAVQDLFDAGIDKPTINIKIDWIELSKTNEYKTYSNLEKVSIGDVVTIDLLGVSYKAKVIKTIYNPLNDKIETFEMGTPKADIGTSTNQILKQIEKVNPTSILEQAQKNAMEQLIKALGGYVYKTQNELFIMDTNDVKTAKKVWRWNLNGLGYSENGVNGPYKTAITQDGQIVADFITTGKLNTNVIEGYESLILSVKELNKIYEKEIITSKFVSANPIEVTDAGEYPLESIGIDGKSYQKTTTGKNKFINIESATYAGITLTHNSDDSYDIVGTSTSTGNIFFQKDIAIEKAMLKDNTHYIISFSQEIDADKILIVSEFYGNGQYKRRLVSSTADYRIGLSNLTDVDTFRCYIMIKVGQTVNIKGLKIQVEEGQVATDIEPYTGGIPSPNPEYPQEIKTVQGITNEFDKSKCVRKKYVNGIVGQLATTIDSETRIFNKGMVATQNAKVSFSLGTTKALRYWLVEVDNTNTIVKVNTITTNKDTSIVTTSTTTRVEVLICWQSVDNVITLDDIADCNIMLVEGNLPERYVPYGRWLEQITIGKNKFDENYPVENYYYDLNGNRVADTTGYINQKYLPVNNKLSFSFSQKNGAAFIRLCEYKDNNTFIKRTLINSNTTITLSNETKYVIWSVDKSSSNYFVDLQIEEGEITPYEEHKENTALIDMNKPNLFDKNNANILNAYATINTPVITSNENFRTLYVPCESNTIYTIEKIASTRFSVSYTTELPSIGISVNNIVQNNTANKEIYQTGNNAKYLVILYYNTTTDTLSEQDILDSIKIYESCEPYYEFAEAGDATDEFSDGEFTKRVEKLVLSSSDNWVNDGRRYYTTAYNNLMITPPNNATKAQALCSINIISATDTFEQMSGLAIHPNGSIYISNDVKTLLDNGDKIVLYIVLKEPKTYKLKYEPLKLHKGYNYITLNDDLYPNMYIKYLTDSKMNADLVSRAEWTMESNRINSEINKKVSNTELDEVIEEQTNKFTQEITDSTNSINLLVTQKIEDIQIGGTNLLPGSKLLDSDKIIIKYIPTVNAYKDFTSVSGYSTSANYIDMLRWDSVISPEPNKEYTLSFYAKRYQDISKAQVTTYFYPNCVVEGITSQGVKTTISDGSVTFTLTSEWKRYWVTYKTLSNVTGAKNVLFRALKNYGAMVCGAKLEEGNKATDWSSAPEDKLDNSKFNKAEIIAEINNGVSNVKIFAENIQLANFVISGGKLTSLVTTKYNFTQSDVTKVRELIMQGSWTTAELNKYDINKNGKIDANDYISIKGIVDGNISIDKPGKFEINTNQDDYTHKGLIYGYDGDGVEKVSIGLGETKLTNLNVKGTLTSSSDFSVAGSASIAGGIATNGQVFANGTVFSNALPVVNTHGIGNNSIKSIRMEYSPKLYFEILTEGGAYGIDAWASDKRLKRRVKDSKYDALDILRKIKHRQFIYRNTNEKVLIGYVADELQELDPNMVFEVGPQKIKQPNPSIIIPILSKAIQEQQEIIDKQDKRITELEDQVKKILELVERGPNGSN